MQLLLTLCKIRRGSVGRVQRRQIELCIGTAPLPFRSLLSLRAHLAPAVEVDRRDARIELHIGVDSGAVDGV